MVWFLPRQEKPSMDLGKISIIIPVYNAEKYLPRCLDSVLAQTYKDMEIIAVDDCSADNSPKILQKYAEKDTRIKVFHLETKGGLFHARIHGAAHSTGAYIAHLDSGGCVSADFYRSLIFDIERYDADMAVGDAAEERDGGKYIFNLADSDMDFGVLEGEEIKKRYFGQEGCNYLWQAIQNKVITRRLWDKAKRFYDKQEKSLVMGEDLLFSTVLYTQAKKIVKTYNNVMFHQKSDRERAEDASFAFSFLDEYLEEIGISEVYKLNFSNWKALYLNREVANSGYFYSVKTEWNPKYEEMKRQIADPSVEAVSFDVFDTLLLRPFWEPTDLFYLLNDRFSELMDGGFVKFSRIRQEAEQRAREKIRALNPTFQDITLDEIYEVLKTEYKIPSAAASEMKKLELETELRFCRLRKSAFALYETALYLGKKIICVSDMYLPKEFIEELLKKCGYTRIDKIYVSSDTRLSKGSGAMYEHILKELHIEGDGILHIGDNHNSDVISAQKMGLKAAHLPKASDAYKQNGGNYHVLKTHYDGKKPALWFWGVRTMLALAANRYFDNPFRSFNPQSDYNVDPELIGYGALGMHLFGVAQWLIENFKERRYDTVVFFARDGYLPMEAFKILKSLYQDMPNEKYLPISRQAILPISVQTESDIYHLNANIHTRAENMLPLLNQIFDIDALQLRDLCEARGLFIDNDTLMSDGTLRSDAHFNEFISICAEHFLNKERLAEKNEHIKEYLQTFFEGKACCFDIGYSAKPEMYISKLIKKPIDTYFMHVTGYTYDYVRDFNLYTYYDYVPNVYGVLDELIISDTHPSCVKYDVSKGCCVPVYEEIALSHSDAFAIQKMQAAALTFIKDMKELFGGHLKLFVYPRFYYNILLRSFYDYPKTLDQKTVAHFVFDNVMSGGFPLISKWNRLRLNNKLDQARLIPSTLLKKIAYYFAIGNLKEKIKSGVKRKLSGHKTLLSIAAFAYRSARKIKRIVSRG